MIRNVSQFVEPPLTGSVGWRRNDLRPGAVPVGVLGTANGDVRRLKMNIFGFFDDRYQTEPSQDPGFEVDCPVCHKRIEAPMVTVSLMLVGDNRSYFYRMHKACSDSVSPELETEIDSLLMDAVGRARNSVN